MKATHDRLTAGLLLAALLGGNASAAMIGADSSVNIAGSVRLDTGSLSSATTVESWWSTVAPNVLLTGISRVQSVAGADFGAFIMDADIVDMTQPWTIGTGVDDLWSVGGFSFNLTSSAFDFRSGSFLNASGTGWITGNGYDPTPGTWYFSAQLPQADGRFSYSAGTSATPTREVPEGGSSLILLGVAILGLEMFRRRQAA